MSAPMYSLMLVLVTLVLVEAKGKPCIDSSGVSHPSGSSFNEDCNSCTCYNGTAGCTLIGCSQWPVTEGKPCLDSLGVSHPSGSSFNEDCNSCTCYNGRALCTMIGCSQSRVPKEPDISMTYTVDGGDSRPVTSHQNLTTCSGVPVELSVCVRTARPGSLLSLKVKGQTTSSSDNCVRMFDKFATSQPVVVSFDEKEFVFNVNVAACVYNWIVFQRRTTGDVDFYRNWTEYVSGFGDVTGDHWLGLEKIHTLCPPSRPCRLRVDMKDPDYKNGQLIWTEYSSFSLNGSSDNYRLSISGYDSRSTAGDGLTAEYGENEKMGKYDGGYHNGMAFSTKDRDNDEYSGNCANQYHGGWWYRNCHRCNLNGEYGVRGPKGLQWKTPDDPNIPTLYASYTEMKIRVLG